MGSCTRRILAVGAAANPHSCWWRWRCCCYCCAPARLGVEQKLVVPVSGRKRKHRSGIYIYNAYMYVSFPARNNLVTDPYTRTRVHGAHTQRIHAYIMTTHA